MADDRTPGTKGETREAREALEAMRHAKARVSAALLKGQARARSAVQPSAAPPPLVGVGIGKKVRGRREGKDMAIRFYVERKIPLHRLPPDAVLPKELEGFPTDVEAVGHIVPFFAGAHRRAVRPVKGGVSVGLGPEAVDFRYAGTLGCWARDARGGGGTLGISNNHVLANENRAAVGAPVVQPGTLEDPAAGRVGSLDRFSPINLAGGMNQVDAAAFAPTDGSLVDPDIMGVGVPTGTAQALRDQRVIKSGRTTGVRRGTVRDVDADIQVQYEEGVGLFENQVAVSGKWGWFWPFSKAGDSGSAILEQGSLKVVALLFAGSDLIDRTFANPIGLVTQALGVTIP